MNYDFVNVIDVESTCWEPPEYQPRDQISEIIEVGIAVVDLKNLVITENEGILIKPQNSKLSKFCTKLTTLTQEQVDKGIFIQEAYELLKNKYGSKNRTFISWGDYDRSMFERNSRDYGIKYPFGPRHHNLKNAFTLLYGLDRELGVDKALEYLGMELEGTHHRGVDDSRNIAKILIHNLKRFRSHGK
jgi:inhibitor of KinA sporulation pathway (predicted exonuclease)